MELDDFFNYSYEYMEYGDFERTEQGYVQRQALHIISVVIYSICFVLGVIGNGMVIWVMAFKSKRTVNTVWLQNLAVADLVFVLFLPFSIDYVLRDFNWKFGLVMCKLNSFVSMMNMYASVLFLMVLSLDRYVSLVHLNWSRRLRTVGRAWAVCGGVWGVAAALSSPALIFRDTVQLQDVVVCFNNFHDENGHTFIMRHVVMVSVRTVVGFLVPFSAISVSAGLIMCHARRSDAVRLSSFSRMVSAVVLAFFLCWAPFHVFSLMELTMHSSTRLHHVLQTGFPLATSLAFLNSCINPVLYVLLGKKVRRLLKQSCLDFTKSSLRELSQSFSGTEAVSASVSSAPEEDPAQTPV
ncbi:G-protein coupled receptor 1-like [Megalops cyprinoides]|uniref:G-protein coupled receptor 1-like n=1 Tax=Megalops cyprinoides TaxID=118141 RepID=UPI001863D0BF|nr:G-protein coupled receptor 1-like [Megalops cyprinoides]